MEDKFIAINDLIKEVQIKLLLKVLVYGDGMATHINVTNKLEELGVDKSHWKEV
jgi:hypothetical protein